MRFDELPLNECLHEAVDSFGFEQQTQIQAETFSPILEGHDLIACAQTGSGKTVAFLLPMMESFLRKPKSGIRALVVAPTRELCMQIEEQVEGLGYFSGQSSISIYGGNDQFGFEKQKNALVSGVDIVVATPGRLISHLNLAYADFSTLDVLVLDEADEMLDMGFYPDIMKIVSKMPKDRQTIMFSATMPPQIKKLAEQILNEPKLIDLNFSKPAAEIDQKVFLVYDKDKPQLLLEVLSQHENEKIIIFVATKQAVGDVSAFLRRKNVKNTPVNSTFTQEEREAAILDFKSGKTNILVTTNLLSRGIDIENVNLILNYQIPNKAEDYVHRIGRTARAGKDGIAISFIGEKEI
ncbi:MAG: DEAD/DEAH box helicase, partial [Bacteroidales bacterium]|nr:DEAD/DEAH box helicase [Bacteroidales bacterium]